MHEKNWRRVHRDLQAWRNRVLVLRLQIARISEDSEVRAAAGFVHLIDRLVGSLVEACGCGDGEMASCRKTNHANALGMNAPFLCPAAHQAHGTLCILDWAPRGFGFGFIGT